MATITVTPSTSAPGSEVDVSITGLDRKKKYDLTTVDANGVESGKASASWTAAQDRPRRDGSVLTGIRVPPLVGPAKVRVYQEGVLAAETSITVADVVAPEPTPEPTYNVVPSAGLAQAIANAKAGDTLWLAGEYSVPSTIWYSKSALTISAVPGKEAHVRATGRTSTMIYGTNCVDVRWIGVSFHGADILENNDNGSSVIGIGPGCRRLTFEKCNFYGSPSWTANVQHIVYFYGNGTDSPRDSGLINCVVDGRGQRSTMVSFYHSVAAVGAIITGCTFRNDRDMAININDSPSSGIKITNCRFENTPIGVFHQRSSGTYVQGLVNGGGCPELVYSTGGGLTDGGGHTR